MTQIVDCCTECGGFDVEWRQEPGTRRHLYCRTCQGELAPTPAPWVWVMYLIAAVVVCYSGWLVTR